MKTAIICDWLVTVAGAEKCLAEMLHCFPDADLFAVVDFVPDEQRGFLLGKKINTTFIQQLPFAQKKYRHYLPLMPFAIERLDVSAYQLIISNSHAVAKGVRTRPDQVHISYTHTPMRYAWDLREQYLQESGLDTGWKGQAARFVLNQLRKWDERRSKNVTHFIANSNYIAKRIQNNYQREAAVIYPPVDTSTFTPGSRKDGFYLAASRLVPYKKMDMIVESFQHMPDKQLVVIGDGPDKEKVKAQAGANVTLLGYQSTEVMLDYMQRAKALIFAAEEDFGIVPLEAQACGTPVIAYGKGGSLETVRNVTEANPTGLFFYQQTTEAVVEAIGRFEQLINEFTIEACVSHAHRFNPARFRNELKEFVEQVHRRAP